MDISNLAVKVATYQVLNKDSRCILVLEEVGVTVNSKHNPLMVLHGLIDRGIRIPAVDDRGIKIPDVEQLVRIPIVGISNWKLDSSKVRYLAQN